MSKFRDKNNNSRNSMRSGGESDGRAKSKDSKKLPKYEMYMSKNVL